MTASKTPVSLSSITSQLDTLARGNALPSTLLSSWLRILDVIGSWEARLETRLVEKLGARGRDLYKRYRGSFDETYQVRVPPESAADDIADLEASGGKLAITWGKPEKDEGVSCLKIFSPARRLPISRVTPVLVHYAFTVEDEESFRIACAEQPVFLHVFRVRAPGGLLLSNDARGAAIARSLVAALSDEIEHDALNALMISASLSLAEVGLLRCLRNYARQIGAVPARTGANNTLVGHPAASRLLVDLFLARFSPDASVRKRGKALAARFNEYLSGVSSLDDDRALRVFQNIVDSVVRTNYFVEGASTIAVKIDCSKIQRMPAPRPWREIYVYGGASMEGCHLRGGPVARGGIRWSERPDDFRTEVLGLMKTQVTKNAQIVPTGAKGGFIVKRMPGDRAQAGEEIRRCYRLLITSMLQMQDNLDRQGRIRRPVRITAHDGDDPYLVVAADKGTATFSDTANALSAEFGFWLGDAFASGGSNGYDHKKEGITARGAWVSVRRHFRDLGKDTDRDPFTAVGIGDMSGDVFGNGMLLSDKIRLVAAFDHRDIFLDPDPDTAVSFRERRRLFALPRSSWQDYAKKALSPGGGVFSRKQKSIPLSEPVRRALGVDAAALDPDSLIRAILKAPVELLYNGGIGTYVKASHEVNSEVGDSQNDNLRVDARDLRCRLVGEGGNLGFTQAGRIEFARGGGRIITDAVDNSAGVDLSDHEVNLKILIDGAKRVVKPAERTKLLRRFKEPIIRDVLKDNHDQTLAVSLDEIRSRRRLPLFARTLSDLERRGVLNVGLEGLPDADELRDRERTGAGLTRPELAVLLSYAKIDTKTRIFDSPIIQKHYLDEFVDLYFAPEMRRHFGRSIRDHRLKNNILVTVLTNRIVNLHGATILHRLTSELGLAASRVCEALIVAREALGLDALIEGVNELGSRVAAERQYEELIAADEAAVLTARWLIRNVPDLRNRLGETRAKYDDVLDRFKPFLRKILPDRDRAHLDAAVASRREAGMPPNLAERLALVEHIPTALDAFALAERHRRPLKAAAETLYEVGDALRLGYLIDQIHALPGRDDWESTAAADVVADLRRSRRRIASRILELGQDIEGYCRERYRSAGTLQAAIARIEAEKPSSVAPYIVISSQLQNLASL